MKFLAMILFILSQSMIAHTSELRWEVVETEYDCLWNLPPLQDNVEPGKICETQGEIQEIVLDGSQGYECDPVEIGKLECKIQSSDN